MLLVEFVNIEVRPPINLDKSQITLLLLLLLLYIYTLLNKSKYNHFYTIFTVSSTHKH
jgi:hypothetical protein